MDNQIIFNPNYVLKPDKGRALIMASLVGRNRIKGIDDSFTNIIHPIYAMILCYIDGREYNECIDEAAEELGVSKELIERFIEKVLDNPEQVYLKNGDNVSVFPPNSIISVSSTTTTRRYQPELFIYSEVDMSMKRHLTPSTITLMVNNICATNCIYCYQDKTRVAKCSIPLKRILELIHEARSLHVNSFDVIGGEFFLFEHWREVLGELRKYGYNPYISTKVPLKEDDIRYLSQIGLCDLQVSIDSLIESHLKPSLGISQGYVDKMLNTLSLLEKYNIPIMVHSVLTKYNSSIKDMESVYSVIRNLSNLIDWHVVKGDPSLYPKTDYNNIEIAPEDLNRICDYLDLLKKESDMVIHIPGKVVTSSSIGKEIMYDPKIEITKFFKRSFCSGLFSSLYILPDGKVTMCEQLYWNKDFIVGDILENSIADVWNSKRANEIYYIKQDDIPEDSQCHSCNYFEACRSSRQVCYREIIRKYGKDKWYYPDAGCPFTKLKIS